MTEYHGHTVFRGGRVFFVVGSTLHSLKSTLSPQAQDILTFSGHILYKPLLLSNQPYRHISAWNSYVRMDRRIRVFSGALLVACALLACSGCATNGKRLFTSRWAMDDEKYAAQYSAPYSDNKLSKWSRMGQQIVDARFEEGKTGLYADGGVATTHRVAAGGEVGIFSLPTSWLTVRAGLVGMLAEGLPSYLVGGTFGVRMHAPTRLSPYVGLAGMAGYSQVTTTADHSYLDNGGHWVSAGDTVLGDSAALAAIIPEAGLSYWISSATRASVGAKYYFTTDGRSQDFLMFGMTLEFSGQNTSSRVPRDPPQTASPELEEVLQSDTYFKSEQERQGYESGSQPYVDWGVKGSSSSEDELPPASLPIDMPDVEQQEG